MRLLLRVFALLLFLGFFLQFAAIADAALLTEADRQAYVAAFAAGRAGDWENAQRLAAAPGERLPATVLRWWQLSKAPSPDFAALTDFADRYPDWPGIGWLRQRAEEASESVPDAVILPYFHAHPPVTPKGRFRFADLLLGSNDAAEARAIIAPWWRDSLPPGEEAELVQRRYGNLLTPEDHAARFDRLIWEGQPAAAAIELPHIAGDQQQAAKARLSLANLAPEGERLYGELPPDAQNAPGLRFELLRWYRRQRRLDEAAAQLLNPPQILSRPAAWWTERQIVTRLLLEDHKDQLAYRILAQGGLEASDVEQADTEFLAGWIALRRLGDGQTGYAHFSKLFSSVKTPVSLARGAYWSGRAAEALGQGEQARQWFATAARQPTTFYGQLAAARLGIAPAPQFPPEPQPGAPAEAAFQSHDFVRIVRMLAELDQSEIAKPFLQRLESSAKTPEDQALIAELSREAKRPDFGVIAARHLASENGLAPLSLAYPILAVPADAARAPVPPPLVLAITRQESGFDPGAVSRSDARGLMQLKPATAADVARGLAVPFSADRLTSEPGFNLTLGQAYLGKLLDQFGGSLPLAIAAYNAGPNRVKQWLAAYGDPRDRNVDPIDWVESIPFSETRNYVQRVLENLQIYRLRLGETSRAFTLSSDLQS